MMHLDKRAWSELHKVLALAQLSSVFLVLEIKILFFTYCFTRCMAVHCMQTLFLRLHLFLQIALGNCSSEGALYNLGSDPSIYLLPHITKDLLLPLLHSSNNFKLLGQAIRLKTVRTVCTRRSCRCNYKWFTEHSLFPFPLLFLWCDSVLFCCSVF